MNIQLNKIQGSTKTLRVEGPISVTLGSGWKMTFSSAYVLCDTTQVYRMQAWFSLARTKEEHVIAYFDSLPDNYAAAEVIFEPSWYSNDANSWRVTSPGQTFLAAIPSSGMNGTAESELLAVVPLEDLVEHMGILTALALEAYGGLV